MIDWLVDHAPSPRALLAFHVAHLLFWLVMIPPSVLWWRESVAYLVALSVWALIASTIAAGAATLAELATKEGR